MTGEPKAIDYAMTDAQSDALKGVVLLPHEVRREALAAYAREHGLDALVSLFSQFVGMANSVVANNRECIELFDIVQNKTYPHEAEKLNLPTLFGALIGVALANATDQRKMCAGCAYRLGTPANQSPHTTCEADYAAKGTFGLYDFMCHERGIDAAGKPTRLCLGHRQMVGAAKEPQHG